MDIPFDCCLYSKEDAQEALNRYVKKWSAADWVKAITLILETEGH